VSSKPFKLPERVTPLHELQAGVDQSPPFSQESEDGFLSGILCRPETRFDEAIVNVPIGAFYSEPKQEFYAMLLAMWRNNTPIDIATVTHRSREMQIIDKIGGAGWISSLFSFQPVSAHFDYFQRVILDKWLLREQIRASLVAVHRCYQYGRGLDDEDINDVLDECEALTRNVRDHSHAGKIEGINEMCLSAQEDFQDQILAASNLQLDEHGNPPIPGLSTGLYPLDEMTMGLCEGHPWLIMAGTSDGKTALAEQISLFSAIESRDPIPVAYYLMESHPHDWIKRGWSYLSGVSLPRILRGTVSNEEGMKVGLAASKMAKSKLILRHVPGVSDVALEADMRYLHRKYGIRLFAVDYLQRVRITQRRWGQNDADALSEFSQRIADNTAKMKATTLLLSQLNEDGKIAKAKAVSWDAEIAFTLSRPLLPGQKDSMQGGRILRGERNEKQRDFSFHKARMTGSRGMRFTANFDGERQRFAP